jgi:predicted phage tail protein
VFTTLWPKLLALLALLVALVGALTLGLQKVASEGAAGQQAVDAKAALAQSEALRIQEAQHAATVASAVENGNQRLLTVARAGGALSATIDRLRNLPKPAACPVPRASDPAATGPAAAAPLLVPPELPASAAELAGWVDRAAIAAGVARAVTP